MTDAIRPTSVPLSPTATPEERRFQDEAQTKLRDTFDEAVASTFYRQMFKALRASTGKAGLIANSQAEKMFQQQLDEVLIERMSKASNGAFSEELFEQQFRNLKGPRPSGTNTFERDV